MDELLILKTVGYFRGDPKRISHFIKVYEFAKLIAEGEKISDEDKKVLRAAAIVHDVGIKPAEQLYGKGNCGGKLQEKLGPEPARKILEEAGADDELVDRVCFLVAHHHSYDTDGGVALQILFEADFLVNAYEDGLSKDAVVTAENKIFKTKTGRSILEEMYGLNGGEHHG